MTEKSSIEAWAEENGVAGIRFFPINPSQSSPSEILNSAMKAVKAMEEGKAVEYKDTSHL